MVERIHAKMIDFYQGNLHDIEHFLKVYAYASLIGKLEKLDAFEQRVLEISAIVHDIACPLCREKYGNTDGKNQEKESEALLRPFLAEFALDQKMEERIIYLVTHHHTLTNVQGKDYRILLEADFLVNASESQMSDAAIKAFYHEVAETTSGRQLMHSIYSSQLRTTPKFIQTYLDAVEEELQEMVPDVDILISLTRELYPKISELSSPSDQTQAYNIVIRKLEEAVMRGAGNFHNEYELLLEEKELIIRKKETV